MISVSDKDSGAALGAITEAQLQFLIDQLEETSLEDTDYYISRATLELLQSAGADSALLELLTRALGDRAGVEIAWKRSE